MSNLSRSTQPLVSCIMPTYGRPAYVNESLKMFLDQDYPAKELILFNDCPGQIFRGEYANVRIINSPRRFATLGEKRNSAIEEAQGDWLAVWDDDDVYLPWRLSYSVREIHRWKTDFYRPAEFWAYWGEDFLHDNQAVPGWINHPTTIFHRTLWKAVEGYPAQDVGEDAEFFRKIHDYLNQPFIKYDIDRSERFMILRGKSHYHHMSIGGGLHPLDTAPGEYCIAPKKIADPKLLRFTKQLKALRRNLVEGRTSELQQ